MSRENDLVSFNELLPKHLHIHTQVPNRLLSRSVDPRSKAEMSVSIVTEVGVTFP